MKNKNSNFSQLIIIDGIPTSQTIWKWFHTNAKEFCINTFLNEPRIIHPTWPKILQSNRDTDSKEFVDNSVDSSNKSRIIYDHHGNVTFLDAGGPNAANQNDNYLEDEDDNDHDQEITQTTAASNQKNIYNTDVNAADCMFLLQMLTMVFRGIPFENKMAFTLTNTTEEPAKLMEMVTRDLKPLVLFWCLTENHCDFDNKFKDLDPILVCTERKGTSRLYHFKAFYYFQEIEDSCRKLISLTQKIGYPQRVLNSTVKRVDNAASAEDLRKEIRRAYKGDLDGFILETINSIQFHSMTNNLSMIAQSVQFEKLGKTDFQESSLPPHDIWRYLFPNYFDGIEDYFERFFKVFTADCIMYYFKDFLQYEFGITYIPAYRIFVRIKENKLIGPNQLPNQLLTLHEITTKQYRNSLQDM